MFAFGRNLVKALWLVRWIDSCRARLGPRSAVERARRRGLGCLPRTPEERLVLKRSIRWADRIAPRGPNCYRRALLEIALDPSAASETLTMGLSADGGPGSGHAWLASEPAPSGYDAIVSV